MAIIQTLKKKTEAKSDKETPRDVSEKKDLKATPHAGGKTLSEEEKAMLAKVIYHPRVTEKTTRYGAARTYAFDVYPHATKRMVKEAAEKMYGVSVVSVRTVNIPRKRRVRGKLEGWKKGYRKALVKIKEGQVIDIGI